MNPGSAGRETCEGTGEHIAYRCRLLVARRVEPFRQRLENQNTSPSVRSPFRLRIQTGSPVFLKAFSWTLPSSGDPRHLRSNNIIMDP